MKKKNEMKKKILPSRHKTSPLLSDSMTSFDRVLIPIRDDPLTSDPLNRLDQNSCLIRLILTCLDSSQQKSLVKMTAKNRTLGCFGEATFLRSVSLFDRLNASASELWFYFCQKYHCPPVFSQTVRPSLETKLTDTYSPETYPKIHPHSNELRSLGL